jgi:hypothetical protein
MRSTVDSVLDVMITLIVIVSCLSFVYATYVKLLNDPSLGFGILTEKSSVKSDAYAEGDVIESFNRYQIACMGLVNPADKVVNVYSETQNDGVVDSSAKLKQFSFRYSKAVGTTGNINLNSRRVPWLSTYSEDLWENLGYDNSGHGSYIPVSDSYSADIVDEDGTLLFYTTTD